MTFGFKLFKLYNFFKFSDFFKQYIKKLNTTVVYTNIRE